MAETDEKGLKRAVKPGTWLRKPEVGGVVTVLIVGLAARAVTLPFESAWYDEVVTLEHLTSPNYRTFLDSSWEANWLTPPLSGFVQYVWAQMFGPGVLTARLLSVGASLVALMLFMLIGARLAGWPAALLSGLIYALNPYRIYFDQEIRVYALLVCWILFSWYFLIRWVSALPARRGWWLLHTGVNSLALWSHPFAALILPAQVLYLALGPRLGATTLARHCLVQGAVCASLLLWLFRLPFYTLDQHTFWIPLPTSAYALSAIVKWMGMSPFLVWPPPVQVLVQALFFVVYLGLAGVLVLSILRRPPKIALMASLPRPENAPPARVLLLALWLFVPPLLAAALSYLWRPVFLDRYFQYSHAALAVLAAMAVMTLRNAPLRYGAAATLVLLVASQLALQYPRPFRTDVQSAVEAAYANEIDYLIVHSRAAASHVAVSYYAERSATGNLQVIAETSLEVAAALVEEMTMGRGKSWWLFEDNPLVLFRGTDRPAAKEIASELSRRGVTTSFNENVPSIFILEIDGIPASRTASR